MSESEEKSLFSIAEENFSPRFNTLKIKFKLSPPSDLSRFSESSRIGVEILSKPDDL